MSQVIITICAIAAAGCSAAALIMVLSLSRSLRDTKSQDKLRTEVANELRVTRQEISGFIQNSVSALGSRLLESQSQGFMAQNRQISSLNEQLTLRQASLEKSMSGQLQGMDERIMELNRRTEARLELMKGSMEKSLTSIQEDNSKKLEQMRQTVDEKLQNTLNERLNQSFAQVSERLEQVYKGLGEMQNLATGVGDLKKILSNVKTRGILGEIQLEAILEQILSPEQYEKNVITNPDSNDRVEFAVRLPGDGGHPVLLPIDAKFPVDAYVDLSDAYDKADSEQITQAGKQLEQRIKVFAKSIRDKYIAPPYTTDFAIMFLPVEGLYAEVVRRGMVEVLQRDYKIAIAGPTTMAALLNSFQMGFRTLAIQKRSGEVWALLGAVKTEFEKFAGVLDKAQTRLRQADKELDTLIGTRTRVIQRKLKDVELLTDEESEVLLEVNGE